MDFQPWGRVGIAVLSTAQMAIRGMQQDADDAGNEQRIVNVHEWFMLFGNDMMYLLTFGEGFGLMDKGERKASVVTPVDFHSDISAGSF